MAQKGFFLKTVETSIEKEGLNYKPFKDSVRITTELFLKIKNRSGDIPVLAFHADTVEPYFSQFNKIFKNIGISYTDATPAEIIRAQKSGKTVTINDGRHWNEEGQKIAGEMLSAFLILKYLED